LAPGGSGCDPGGECRISPPGGRRGGTAARPGNRRRAPGAVPWRNRNTRPGSSLCGRTAASRSARNGRYWSSFWRDRHSSKVPSAIRGPAPGTPRGQPARPHAWRGFSLSMSDSSARRPVSLARELRRMGSPRARSWAHVAGAPDTPGSWGRDIHYTGPVATWHESVRRQKG
jgi:hypothetical protein